MISKKERLETAIRKFRDSKQTALDYMDLFVAVHTVLKQGDGLVWSQVNEIVKEVLNSGRESA